MLEKIDHSAIKTSQFCLIIFNILAFILNIPWLVALITLVLILGILGKRPGFGFVYTRLLKPLGWLKPEVLLDNPEPHRFSQGLAGLFMGTASLMLWLGAPALGWGLVWMVAGLAALNVFVGFCVGCAVYYWLNRMKVRGFYKAPPSGVLPGMRPRKSLESKESSL